MQYTFGTGTVHSDVITLKPRYTVRLNHPLSASNGLPTDIRHLDFVLQKLREIVDAEPDVGPQVMLARKRSIKVISRALIAAGERAEQRRVPKPTSPHQDREDHDLGKKPLSTNAATEDQELQSDQPVEPREMDSKTETVRQVPVAEASGAAEGNQSGPQEAEVRERGPSA